MSLLHTIRFSLSSLAQSIKRPARLRALESFVKEEIAYIGQMPRNTGARRGTIVVKCDDIGDLFMWQQVIPFIVENAEKPLYFVTTSVNRPLIEHFFDFADGYIYIDKSRWGDKAYRQQQYQAVHSLKANMAFTPLFTRNLKMDDLLVLASDAARRVAWDMRHHAYFPSFKFKQPVTTDTITSDKPIELEYFRNIEFIEKLYNISLPHVISPMFPSFGKQNRLVVVPVSNAPSKCWAPALFADVIKAVSPQFDSVLLLGGPNSVAACKFIEEKCGLPKLINLAGETQLHELVPFIGESRLLLCADTFALHVAVQTSTDLVLVSNGTNWQRFSNYAPYVSSQVQVVYPDFFHERPEKQKLVYSRSEINTIAPEKVIKAIKTCLSRSAKDQRA